MSFYTLISGRILFSFIQNGLSLWLKSLLCFYRALWNDILPSIFESVFITFYTHSMLQSLIFTHHEVCILWNNKVKCNCKLDSWFCIEFQLPVLEKKSKKNDVGIYIEITISKQRKKSTRNDGNIVFHSPLNSVFPTCTNSWVFILSKKLQVFM